MGALLVFFFASLWLARGHLGRMLRCALGRGERGYDAGEPTPYRVAVGASVAKRVWRSSAISFMPWAVVILVVL